MPSPAPWRITKETPGTTVSSAAQFFNSLLDVYRQAAGVADIILKGKKPADLAVMRPIKTQLAINLKTARALNLAVPQDLIATANEVTN